MRVVVYDLAHAPAHDSHVLFHDQDGLTIDEVPTDGDGIAISGQPGIAAITTACPSGDTATIDWGIDDTGLTIGFTSSSVPGQTLWPRFHFRPAP